MKLLLTLGTLFTTAWAASAGAALPEEVPSPGPCSAALESTLKSTGATGGWIRQVDPEPRVTAFRSPTRKLGSWTELRSAPGLLVLRVIDAKRTRSYRFVRSGSGCKRTLTESATPHHPGLATEGFTDQDLARLLGRKSKALIYVWSPRMVYSLTFLDIFRQTAAKKGLQFIALMDPRVETKVATLAAAKAGMSLMNPKSERMLASEAYPDNTLKLASFELFMRNPTIHFPTSFVISDGQIAAMRILGVKTEPFIEANIDAMLESLK